MAWRSQTPMPICSTPMLRAADLLAMGCSVGLAIAASLGAIGANEPPHVLLLDVRTRAEAMYLGMAGGVDALVPFVEHQELMLDWDGKRNICALESLQDFVPEVNRRLQAKDLGKADPVVLMCRSDDRSSRGADRPAASTLSSASNGAAPPSTPLRAQTCRWVVKGLIGAKHQSSGTQTQAPGEGNSCDEPTCNDPGDTHADLRIRSHRPAPRQPRAATRL